MSPSNIAIVLSPNLLWNQHENLNVNIGNCVTINILVELFIREVDVLFPEDASKYVTIQDLFNYEEFSNNLKSSHTNLAYIAESPKPSQRKKKSAPVPPISLNKSGDRDAIFPKPDASSSNKILESERKYSSTETKSPNTESRVNVDSKGTIDRKTTSPKEQRSPQAIVRSPGVIQTKSEHTQTVQKTPPNVPYKPENILSTHKIVSSNKTDQNPQMTKPVITKTDETTMTENVERSEKISSVPLQGKPNDQKFTTTAVHRIVQPSNQSVIFDNKHQTVSSPLSNKSKNMSESVEDILIRRKDPSMKPEVPARPSSLSVRPPSDLDPMLRRTQCSVYNVANKQQPSIINIQNRNEIYQRGHDNQMAEKEKFLGHKPDPENRDNNLGGINFNSSDDLRERSKSISSSKLVIVENDDKKMLKSNEELNVSSAEKENNCDTNSNQKSSHTRARSDGSVIDITKGTNLSFRSISKPTEPPPPPPTQS